MLNVPIQQHQDDYVVCGSNSVDPHGVVRSSTMAKNVFWGSALNYTIERNRVNSVKGGEGDS